jgi:hypothetical protein
VEGEVLLGRRIAGALRARLADVLRLVGVEPELAADVRLAQAVGVAALVGVDEERRP